MPKATSWWQEVVSTQNEFVRIRAAQYLSWQKNSTFLPLLQEMALKDESEQVRLAAIAALALLTDKEATDTLITCLQDSDMLIRWTAQKALEGIGRHLPEQASATRTGPQPDSNGDEPLIQLIS